MPSTTARLRYGSHEFVIDGAAHADVSTSIVQAHGRGGGWVEVPADSGAVSVFITPGVPIVLEQPAETSIGVW